MTAVWPGTLPQNLQVQGYSEAMRDGRLRTPTDSGAGKSRLRSTAVVAPVSGQFEMTAAQWSTLMSFVMSDLRGGTLPFTFPAPLGGTAWLVRLGENMPSRTNLGGDAWMVTLQLEVLP